MAGYQRNIAQLGQDGHEGLSTNDWRFIAPMTGRIGLTGGIGSGKSTVAQLFQALGTDVIDADQIARSLTKQGTIEYQAIIDHFGENIVLSDGELDRKQLGQIAFRQRSALQFLEKLLHPAIRDEMTNRASVCTGPYCILEIPLLIENQQHKEMDRVLVIACNTDIRIRRLMESRKMSRDRILNVMENQLSDQDRLNYADDVIDNNRSVGHLKKQVLELHNHYCSDGFFRV